MQLSVELKKLYPDYSVEVLPIVLEATGLITSKLTTNLQRLKIEKIKETIAKCQKLALLGTLKIVKSVMNMKNI